MCTRVIISPQKVFCKNRVDNSLDMVISDPYQSPTTIAYFGLLVNQMGTDLRRKRF